MTSGIFQRVKEFFTGKPETQRRQQADGRGMRSRIDAASNTDENKKYWGQADAFGPNAAFDPQTRYRLRNRGRYESINNSYARGLIRTLAYDLVGTGPRLQLSIPGGDYIAAAKVIEQAYAAWSRAACIGGKYRLFEKAAARCGELFGIHETNEKLRNPVKFDIRLIEAEQCTALPSRINDPYHVDGIQFDANWQPTEYWFLKYHPGESFGGIFGVPADYMMVPASRVVHWFEQDRTGQQRGIPRITSGLQTFGQFRRYSAAVLTAAEIAAMLAGIMHTNLPADGSTPAPVENWNMVELVRGALMALPEGWDATQFKPEQPQAQFADYKRENLSEAGRGCGAPLNVVSGNSSGYNFSSGRLDFVPYQRDKRIDRDDFRDRVVDPVFYGWLEEALMVPDLIPSGLPPVEKWVWTWNWDGFGSIDPLKDAHADDIRLKNGTATYAQILAEDGKDWQEHFDQVAREKAYAEKLGLPYPLLFAPTQQQEVTTDDLDQKNAPGAKAAELRAALEEAGIDEDKAAEVTEEFFALIGKRYNPSTNGHATNGAGGKR